MSQEKRHTPARDPECYKRTCVIAATHFERGSVRWLEKAKGSLIP